MLNNLLNKKIVSFKISDDNKSICIELEDGTWLCIDGEKIGYSIANAEIRFADGVISGKWITVK